MGKVKFIIVFMLITGQVAAQEIVPQGYFLQDSVKIGEELPYALWARYPKDLDVVFPDSLYDFSPFELDRKVYFPTVTDSLLSLDSVVYYLSTFEIDTVQYLTLPVFIINEYDSTTRYTTPDSVILDQVITTLPDSAAVIVNTAYQKVPLAFNYPYFTVGAILLAIIVLVTYLVFGQRINRYIKVYRLQRRHRRFIKTFDEALAREPVAVEHTLSLWKNYLEKLLAQPFAKLTTKEIIALTGDEKLGQQLQLTDRYIYGGEQNDGVRNAFEELLLYAIDRFNEKTQEIKHG